MRAGSRRNARRREFSLCTVVVHQGDNRSALRTAQGRGRKERRPGSSRCTGDDRLARPQRQHWVLAFGRTTIRKRRRDSAKYLVGVHVYIPV